MSEVVRINLDLGDGLHTNAQDKLDVYYEPNGNMHLETSETPGETGIYVNDLNGADGTGGASTPDGWTTKSGTGWDITSPSTTTPDFVDMNRNVVNLIFTFGLHKAQVRNATTITYSSDVKDVRSICNEIVAPVYFDPSSYTSFHPEVGEIIQLVENPIFRVVPRNGSTIACENGNRIANDLMETAAMFVVTAIRYMSDIQQGGNAYWVYDMTITCIFSSVPEYVVGQSYTGSQLFDANHI